jgi:hypothetical protein
MNKREHILLLALVLTVAAAFFYTTITSSQDTLRESEKGIARYEAAIQKIEAETIKAAGSDEDYDAVQIISITDAADIILSQLKKQGITPARYQITGTNVQAQRVEFVYTCEPEALIRFAASAAETRTCSYTVTDAAVKQERDGGVSVVMHAAASPCRFLPASDKGSDDVHRLARLFTGSRTSVTPADKVSAVPSVPSPGTAKFRIIGTVRGADGVQYVYVKNAENNKLYKLAPDKIRENSDKRYILVIDDVEYEILKK